MICGGERAPGAHEALRFEQACAQRTPLGSIELRRMEFEAVRRIADALGVKI